jgi:hypothetical protein
LNKMLTATYSWMLKKLLRTVSSIKSTNNKNGDHRVAIFCTKL